MPPLLVVHRTIPGDHLVLYNDSILTRVFRKKKRSLDSIAEINVLVPWLRWVPGMGGMGFLRFSQHALDFLYAPVS